MTGPDFLVELVVEAIRWLFMAFVGISVLMVLLTIVAIVMGV